MALQTSHNIEYQLPMQWSSPYRVGHSRDCRLCRSAGVSDCRGGFTPLSRIAGAGDVTPEKSHGCLKEHPRLKITSSLRRGVGGLHGRHAESHPQGRPGHRPRWHALARVHHRLRDEAGPHHQQACRCKFGTPPPSSIDPPGSTAHQVLTTAHRMTRMDRTTNKLAVANLVQPPPPSPMKGLPQQIVYVPLTSPHLTSTIVSLLRQILYAN